MNTTKIVLVLLLSFIPIASVSAESTDRTEQMRLLLDQCGILERLQEFPRQVFKEMGHEGGSSQPKNYAPDREAFFHAFNVEEMEQDLIAQMTGHMDEPTVALALKWFKSPVGMRITDLERTTYTANAWQGRQVFVQGLAHSPPDQHRIAQIQRLTEGTYLAQIDEDLEMTTAMALTGAMNATLPPEEHIDPDHIRHELQVQRDDMKQVLQEERLINFLYLYHRLQDHEIEQYLAFLDSETGKRFNSSMLASLKVVFRSAGEKIGTALGRALKGERQI